MQISDAGLDFVVSFEGKLKKLDDGRYKAYRCPAGVCTIYAGCTEGVTDDMIVTEDQGKAMFRREMAKHEKIVSRLVTVEITQAQFDSLVSFSYNTGGLAGSTLLKKLNAGDVLGAADEFRNWTKARDPKTGKRVVLNGLVRRRKAEAAMFVADLPGSDQMPQAATQTRPINKETVAVVASTIGAAGTHVGYQTATPAPAVDVKKHLEKAQEVRTQVETAKDLGTWAKASLSGDGAWLFAVLGVVAIGLIGYETLLRRRS